MKTLKVFALSLSLVMASLVTANAATQEIAIPINEAFIPSGFDSESDVYVVASGMFPNSCYQWNRAAVSHDSKDNVHTVRAFAEVSQGMCLMVLVPFTKEIELGQLDPGLHKVRFLSGDGTYMEKTLQIE